MNDPIFLALVGIVIFLTLALVIVLSLWLKKVLGENNSLRITHARAESQVGRSEVATGSQRDLVNNLVSFALAYRERVQARGKKVEPANVKMRYLWEFLPGNLRADLVPLGMLADLKVSGDAS